MGKCYELVSEFKKKYPMTIAFRLPKHCKIIEKHLNPDEKILYAFPAQKNSNVFEIFYTNVVALTNKRILIATKRVLWGYFLITITPDMFNDLTVRKGLIFGSVLIDTVKERVALSNLDPNSLPEIESIITEYMMEEKKKYIDNSNN
ncbi:MAG: PH domain-containing protein [Erysipelotrichaceae bacterium]|nr:PH domain-containing protein [Erysipelotrichaceae bacterium]